MAAAAEAEADRVPLTIRNPSPQGEIDRLLAAGGPARGVVVRATHQAISDGERVQNMKVTIRVRARLAGGELGEPVPFEMRTSSWVIALLDPGLEIPIELDRVTGLVRSVHGDLLKQELEPRKAEASQRWPGWGSDYF